MDKGLLIVPPGPRSLGHVLRRLSGQPFHWAYLGQDMASFHRAERSFHGRGTHLDTTHRFHQAAETLLKPYLAYVYGIGREMNSLRWWLTSLSYRNVDTSRTFYQACYLKVALDLVKTWDNPEPLVLVVVDQPLRLAVQRNLARDRRVSFSLVGIRRYLLLRWARDWLSMLVHRAFFILRHTYRVLESRRMISRPQVPGRGATILISSASTANLRQGGEFHRSFFGDLVVRLGELGCPVAVMPIIPPGVQYRWALFQLRDSPQPLLVPHRYLRLLDLIRTAFSSSGKPPSPHSVPTFLGMDISPLVKEELRRDWIGNQAAEALLMTALVRRWASLGFSITRIIYLYENQPWERALTWEVRRYLPGTLLVGYQHARAPRLMLNLYLAPGGEVDAPLPDRVVAVGQHSARLLSADGHDPTRIRVGGALQMQDLLALRSRANEPLTERNDHVVLVAPSNALEEAVELVDMALRLFDEEEGVRIVVKCHPITPFEKVRGFIRERLPRHVEVSDEPISDLMLKSSVMVYGGSTVCIQALALGLPAVHLRPRFDLDLDPLEATPDIRLEALGLEELRQKVRWLLDHREEYVAQHRDRWAELVQEMYGPVTEQTFRAFVD